jgi:hypothetical protein
MKGNNEIAMIMIEQVNSKIGLLPICQICHTVSNYFLQTFIFCLKTAFLVVNIDVFSVSINMLVYMNKIECPQI